MYKYGMSTFDEVKKAFQQMSHTAVSIDGVLSLSAKLYREFEQTLEAHDCYRDGPDALSAEEQDERDMIDKMSSEQVTLYLARNGISPEDSSRSLAEAKAMVKMTKIILAQPVPVVVHCPLCKVQHIDRDEGAIDWRTRPHRKHLCKPAEGGCGHIFKVSNLFTVGVETLPEAPE